ncbi:MAG: HEAT repeat domain-containing protein, partial [Planctomycetota bacterium]
LNSLAVICGRAFVDRKKPINMSELTNRIIEISKESETLFRHQAAFILGTLSTPEAIDRLTAMLEDGDQMARVNAVVGLARQNSTAGIPMLEKLFGEAASWKLDPSAVKNDEQATQHFERVMLVTNGMLAVQNLSPQLDTETKKRLLELISQCADQAVDIAVQKQWVATKAALSQ